MQDGEEAFLNFRRVVESANVIMATYADEALGDTQVSFYSLIVNNRDGKNSTFDGVSKPTGALYMIGLQCTP